MIHSASKALLPPSRSYIICGSLCVLAASSITACPEGKQEELCGSNLHTDDLTCKNGIVDIGELCLSPVGSIPLAKYMHAKNNATLADFNGDGHLDLRVGSDIYSGFGNGAFAETYIRPNPSTNAVDCASGDYNGDGVADLAYSAYSINPLDDPDGGQDVKRVTLWLGNPKLDPGSIYTFDEFANYPVDVASGDFNSDGFDDLVISTRSWDIARCSAEVLISKQGDALDWSALLDGQGGHGEGEATCNYLAFDFDGDGHLDLDTLLDDLHMGTANGVFVSKTSGPRPNARSAQYGHDLDCDGLPDAVDIGGGSVRAWKNLGDTQFAETYAVDDIDVSSLTVAELNGDGEPDVVVSGEGGVHILFGGADMTFSAPLSLTNEDVFSEAEVGDLNEDGAPDLVAIGSQSVLIFLSTP